MRRDFRFKPIPSWSGPRIRATVTTGDDGSAPKLPPTALRIARPIHRRNPYYSPSETRVLAIDEINPPVGPAKKPQTLPQLRAQSRYLRLLGHGLSQFLSIPS